MWWNRGKLIISFTQILRLDHNIFPDLSTFPKIESLAELYIRHNELSTLTLSSKKPISAIFPNLAVLNVSDNKIADLAGVFALEKVEGLTELVRLKAPGAVVAWNPEFLREGFAVNDTLTPDRLVYGIPAGAEGEHARRVLDEVYSQILPQTPLVVTDLTTAQLVKVAANSFLATKISFINAMAEFCEATGVTRTNTRNVP